MNRVLHPSLPPVGHPSPGTAASAAPADVRPIVTSAGRVDVRDETPMLPRAAFVTITLASLLGAIFTGRTLGLAGVELVWRWSAFWALAVSTGFLAWRSFYLREHERGVDAGRVRSVPFSGSACWPSGASRTATAIRS